MPTLGPKALTKLKVALGQNEWLAEMLGRFEEIALPDSWLVAGCIAQTIWNLSFRKPAEFGVKDVDLIYFDPQDLTAETEAGHEQRLRHVFRGLPINVVREYNATLGRGCCVETRVNPV